MEDLKRISEQEAREKLGYKEASKLSALRAAINQRIKNNMTGKPLEEMRNRYESYLQRLN